jgi:hypothetical protein
MNYLTPETVRNLPVDLLPMPVFSTCLTSFFSFGIRAKKKSIYSHFMWAHRPGYFASQHLWFKEVPVDKFLNKCQILKFWTIDFATKSQKELVISRINEELKKPLLKTRYDVLAIFGQLLGLACIQSPWAKICSEHAAYLHLIDSRYPEKECLAPNEVNTFLKTLNGYSVYGKYQIEE